MNQQTETDAADEAAALDPASPQPQVGLLRRLYDWVLSWADTPYGLPALVGVSFAESSFFPVPPDVLLIPLVLGAPKRWWRLAGWCTVASLVGGLAGYGIGYLAWDTIGQPIVDFYQYDEVVAEVRSLYTQWGFWGIVTAAITPIPYKVFTISSGLFTFPIGQFVVASAIGRSVRFFAVALLLYYFGKPVRAFIDRYFNLLAIVFTVLLIGGFFLIKVMAN